MDEIQNKKRAFPGRLWDFFIKTANRIAYIAAPIIIIRFIYLGIIGEITFNFDLLSFIFAIFAIILLPITILLAVGPSNKNINKQISKTDWNKWIGLGKFKFVLYHTYRYFAIITTCFTIGFLILDYKEAMSFFNHIYYIYLIINFSMYGIVFGLNTWNYKMNEQNTIRNRILNLFIRTPAYIR